jgi:hypothetical protein
VACARNACTVDWEYRQQDGARDPSDKYSVDFLVDNLQDGDPRTMALSLVSNALEYPASQFVL